MQKYFGTVSNKCTIVAFNSIKETEGGVRERKEKGQRRLASLEEGGRSRI